MSSRHFYCIHLFVHTGFIFAHAGKWTVQFLTYSMNTYYLFSKTRLSFLFSEFFLNIMFKLFRKLLLYVCYGASGGRDKQNILKFKCVFAAFRLKHQQYIDFLFLFLPSRTGFAEVGLTKEHLPPTWILASRNSPFLYLFFFLATNMVNWCITIALSLIQDLLTDSNSVT